MAILKLSIEVDESGAIKDITQFTNAVDKMDKKGNKAAKRLSKSFKDFRDKSVKGLQRVGTAAKRLTLLLGAGGLAGAMILPIKLAGDLEAAMLDVQKTTGESATTIDELRREFISISKEMPISARELANIGAVAGQLGIKGKKDILEFTRVIGQMAITTDLSAEEASIAMAQLTNVLGEPISKVVNLGSVMNELSNTTVATARDIANITLRMGTQARQLGLTSAEALAFSATIRDIGVTAEVGGTALSAVFGKMLTDTEKLADAAGIELQDFQKAIADDPIKAIEMLIEKIGELDKVEAAKALSEMGFEGRRVVSVMGGLSNNLDKLRANLKTANEEMELATSLQREYEIFIQGTWSQMKILVNQIVAVGLKIGNDMLPVVKELISDLKDNLIPFLSELGDKFINNKEAITEFITGGYEKFKTISSDLFKVLVGLSPIMSGFFGIIESALTFAVSNPKIFGTAGIIGFMLWGPTGAIAAIAISAGIDTVSKKIAEFTTGLKVNTSEFVKGRIAIIEGLIEMKIRTEIFGESAVKSKKSFMGFIKTFFQIGDESQLASLSVSELETMVKNLTGSLDILKDNKPDNTIKKIKNETKEAIDEIKDFTVEIGNAANEANKIFKGIGGGQTAKERATAQKKERADRLKADKKALKDRLDAIKKFTTLEKKLSNDVLKVEIANLKKGALSTTKSFALRESDFEKFKEVSKKLQDEINEDFIQGVKKQANAAGVSSEEIKNVVMDANIIIQENNRELERSFFDVSEKMKENSMSAWTQITENSNSGTAQIIENSKKLLAEDQELTDKTIANLFQIASDDEASKLQRRAASDLLKETNLSTIDAIKLGWGDAFTSFGSFTDNMIGLGETLVKSLRDGFKDVFVKGLSGDFDDIGDLFDALLDRLKGAVIDKLAGIGADLIVGLIPGFAKGGMIQEDGIIQANKGELILNPNQVIKLLSKIGKGGIDDVIGSQGVTVLGEPTAFAGGPTGTGFGAAAAPTLGQAAGAIAAIQTGTSLGKLIGTKFGGESGGVAGSILGGAAGGAAAGTFILPGIGTVAGAFIGGVLGPALGISAHPEAAAFDAFWKGAFQNNIETLGNDLSAINKLATQSTEFEGAQAARLGVLLITVLEQNKINKDFISDAKNILMLADPEAYTDPRSRAGALIFPRTTLERIPSFQKGIFKISSDTPAFIHEGESVLTKEQTNILENGAGESKGNTEKQIIIQVENLFAKDISTLIDEVNEDNRQRNIGDFRLFVEEQNQSTLNLAVT